MLTKCHHRSAIEARGPLGLDEDEFGFQVAVQLQDILDLVLVIDEPPVENDSAAVNSEVAATAENDIRCIKFLRVT